jgi:hypothetical protein
MGNKDRFSVVGRIVFAAAAIFLLAGASPENVIAALIEQAQ